MRKSRVRVKRPLLYQAELPAHVPVARLNHREERWLNHTRRATYATTTHTARFSRHIFLIPICAQARKFGIAKTGPTDNDAHGMNNIRNVFRFGRVYLRRYWSRLLAGILLGLFFGVSNASFVWATRTLTNRLAPAPPAAIQKAGIPSPLSRHLVVLKEKVDRVIDPWLPQRDCPLNWKMFLGGLLLLPLLASVRSVCDYLSSYCMGWVSERVVNDLRVDVLTKLSTLSLDFFDRATSGDLLTRITGDTATLQRALRTGAADLVKESMSVLGLISILCLIDWKLTVFALIFLPLCFYPMLVLGRKARRASKASLDTTVSQSSQLVELLASIRIVKAFGLEEAQLRRFRQSSSELVRFGMKGIQAREQINPFVEFISTLGIGVLVVYIFHAHRQVPDLVAFLTGVVLFYVSIRKLMGIHIVFEQTSVSVARLMDVFRQQPAVKELPRPKTFPQFASQIAFENVNFSYCQKPVLHHVNLTIPRGFKLGIAGESGSGKSTLINLIFRFYDPTAGAVKIDGLDLRDISLADLRRQMALVSQEVVVFDQSVAENIVCGKNGATREEVEAAARHASAHEFIAELPRGYDTRLGERGVTLSGGQRQRIAIARAFIRNAPILVLDEATAALDSQAEAEVQAAIDRLTEHRTVICVAHRLSTLAAMDRIVVLSEGQIVESGTFDQLLRHEGMFTAMARKQGIWIAAGQTA